MSKVFPVHICKKAQFSLCGPNGNKSIIYIHIPNEMLLNGYCLSTTKIIEKFNLFHARFLKGNFPFLNLDLSVIVKRDVNQNSKKNGKLQS